jgi:NAD(P)-dependent dehydrogenase (short-subunit alcohol dehydrogenase family)
MPTAIVTGASRGLGFALATALEQDGWTVITDAREGNVTVTGDVVNPKHRRALVDAAGPEIDLLVNNASRLGPSPQPVLINYPLDVLERVFRVNVLAPVGMIQAALPKLAEDATIVNISSDAAVEAYAGWAGYGASKAALDQVSSILAAEHPELRVYAFDPGDMRTRMHQEAFPGEDISDRPLPEEVAVPALLALIRDKPASGRFRAEELVPA